MFGYATDETPELMPLTHVLATQLGYKLTEVRKNGTCPWLRPDGKTQVRRPRRRRGRRATGAPAVAGLAGAWRAARPGAMPAPAAGCGPRYGPSVHPLPTPAPPPPTTRAHPR